jgi:tRNA(fMet)-specific endonuclease VapC
MATKKLGIDTDIVIDYLRRRTGTLERAIGSFDCSFTAITVYELEIGLVHASRQSALFHELLGIVSVLPLDHDAAHAAASVYEQLRIRGLPIGLQDTLIAGTCIAHNIPLLTRNVEHLSRIDELSVITPAHLI